MTKYATGGKVDDVKRKALQYCIDLPNERSYTTAEAAGMISRLIGAPRSAVSTDWIRTRLTGRTVKMRGGYVYDMEGLREREGDVWERRGGRLFLSPEGIFLLLEMKLEDLENAQEQRRRKGTLTRISP